MDDLVYYDFTENEWVPVTPVGDKPVSIHLILTDGENEMKHGKWQIAFWCCQCMTYFIQ